MPTSRDASFSSPSWKKSLITAIIYHNGRREVCTKCSTPGPSRKRRKPILPVGEFVVTWMRCMPQGRDGVLPYEQRHMLVSVVANTLFWKGRHSVTNVCTMCGCGGRKHFPNRYNDATGRWGAGQWCSGSSLHDTEACWGMGNNGLRQVGGSSLFAALPDTPFQSVRTDQMYTKIHVGISIRTKWASGEAPSPCCHEISTPFSFGDIATASLLLRAPGPWCNYVVLDAYARL